jgi:hypothetical protein
MIPPIALGVKPLQLGAVAVDAYKVSGSAPRRNLQRRGLEASAE